MRNKADSVGVVSGADAEGMQGNGRNSALPRVLFVKACALAHLVAGVRAATAKGVKVPTTTLAVEAHADNDVAALVVEVESERSARETLFVRADLPASSFDARYLGAGSEFIGANMVTATAGDSSRLPRIDNAVATCVAALESAIDVALSFNVPLADVRAAALAKLPRAARGAQPSTVALAALDSIAARAGVQVTVGRATLGAKGAGVAARHEIELRA